MSSFLPLLPVLLLLPNTLRPAAADFSAIGGYRPQNDVTQHTQIDLDMAVMSGSNITAAYTQYTQGGNSVKSSGAIRTIKSFSTGYASMQGEKWYDIFAAYWSDPAYADTFTSAACQGTGDFAESTSPLVSDTARGEACVKGAQFQNLWMYMIHEMEEAVEDCNAGTIGAHWDEAVAFYVGSLSGTSGSVATGNLQFTLAEKRCLDFGTCDLSDDDAAYTSNVNVKVLELFESGRDYQYDHAGTGCAKMESTKEALVSLFTVPLLQGTLKYLYFADLTESEKTRAELWAFAAALLPILHNYDPAVAKTVRSNTEITNINVVSSGYAEVKYQIESLYTHMGVTCADVGGLSSPSYSSGHYPGMQPCSEISTSSSSSNNNNNNNITEASSPLINKKNETMIFLFVFFLLAFVLSCIGFVFYYKKSRDLHMRLHMRDGTGNNKGLHTIVSAQDDHAHV